MITLNEVINIPGGSLGETLMPVPPPDGGTDLYIRQELYHKQFCADVPESEARRMAATQRPCTELALTQVMMTQIDLRGRPTPLCMRQGATTRPAEQRERYPPGALECGKGGAQVVRTA